MLIAGLFAICLFGDFARIQYDFYLAKFYVLQLQFPFPLPCIGRDRLKSDKSSQSQGLLSFIMGRISLWPDHRGNDLLRSGLLGGEMGYTEVLFLGVAVSPAIFIWFSIGSVYFKRPESACTRQRTSI